MKNTSIIKTYAELIQLNDFLDRFHYLKLDGKVGEETFGFDRYLNQEFYHSIEWRSMRDYIIVRDLGCDLGLEGFEIHGRIYIHHMNPIDRTDILNVSDYLLNPDFLICVSRNTHNAIHYSDESLLSCAPVERTPYDTCPWKRFERR